MHNERILRRWIYLTIAVLCLAALGVIIGVHLRTGSHHVSQAPPTNDEYAGMLATNLATDDYARGGTYLAEYQKAADPHVYYHANYNRNCELITRHICIDFLRTVTPQQRQQLQDKMPFDKLTQPQQQILMQLPEYIEQHPGTGAKNSVLWLEIWRTGSPYLQLHWLDKTAPHGGYFTQMFFLKDAQRYNDLTRGADKF